MIKQSPRESQQSQAGSCSLKEGRCLQTDGTEAGGGVAGGSRPAAFPDTESVGKEGTVMRK